MDKSEIALISKKYFAKDKISNHIRCSYYFIITRDFPVGFPSSIISTIKQNYLKTRQKTILFGTLTKINVKSRQTVK